MTPSCWPLGPPLRGVCLFALLCVSLSARQLLNSPSPGPARSQELVLLEFSQGFSDFQAVVSKNRLRGWGQSDLGVCSSASEIVTSSAAECDPLHQIYRNANRNSWTGVTCNPAGEVVCIHLQGFSLHGAAAGIATLQDLPSLGYLNLADNELSGPLPEDLGASLSSLQILHLEDNAVNSTLAPDWGTESGWSNLEQLYLQKNNFYGTLPSAWATEGYWDSLQLLNVSNNHLQGSIPESYANSSGWKELQLAYVLPGNSFCGDVPEGFPAVKATGSFVTGPTFDSPPDFNKSCDSKSEVIVTSWSPDTAGEDLSHGAIAGIITGEVLLGTFLLLCSGTIHRRYRWRQERSWVLFDWDVVAETPPKPFINFGARFGWGSKSNVSAENIPADTPNSACCQKLYPTIYARQLMTDFLIWTPKSLGRSTSEHLIRDGNGFLANGGNGFHSPAKVSCGGGQSSALDTAAAVPVGGNAGRQNRPGFGSFSDMIWQDSLLTPDDVVIQQNADGSLRQLGNGSFGKVYKGVLQDVHEVAVKVFEGYAGQREQDLLLKEISILRSCRNKNIVQFFGVTVHDDDIWMIMELMDGNLFRHLARGHHCTWYFRGRSIALDIARGMHFLHSRRIIHMDLKSPNILLSSNGTAKIADVGLARVMGSESIANQVCAGTMHWMAPEVLINGRCTEKADIFSFGVILWEICTAEAPTRGRMSAVSVPDECPAEVAQLIEWCMEEDPDKRPSALDIIHRIQVVPVTSRPVPQPPWYAR